MACKLLFPPVAYLGNPLTLSLAYPTPDGFSGPVLAFIIFTSAFYFTAPLDPLQLVVPAIPPKRIRPHCCRHQCEAAASPNPPLPLASRRRSISFPFLSPSLSKFHALPYHLKAQPCNSSILTLRFPCSLTLTPVLTPSPSRPTRY